MAKGDNWYRHWFLDQIMEVQLKLKQETPDFPVPIEFILKKAKDRQKADKAYYFLWADKSVHFITDGELVQLTDKGRNELLSDHYRFKELEQRTLRRNNNLLVLSNCIMAAGVVGAFIVWVKPNLRQELIEWLGLQKAEHKQPSPSHPPSKNQLPIPYKTYVIDSAKHKKQ